MSRVKTAPVTPENGITWLMGRSSGLPSSFPAPSRANTVANAESSGLQQRGLRRNYYFLSAPASRLNPLMKSMLSRIPNGFFHSSIEQH